MRNPDREEADPTQRTAGEPTPGPWKAVRRAGSYTSPFVIQGPGGRHVANLTGNNLDEGRSQTIGEAEANARLIAAAPTLLSALRTLVNLHTDGSGPAEEIAFQLAIEAIATAKGER